MESHSRDKAEKGLYVIDSKSQLAHLTIDLKIPVNIKSMQDGFDLKYYLYISAIVLFLFSLVTSLLNFSSIFGVSSSYN